MKKHVEVADECVRLGYIFKYILKNEDKKENILARTISLRTGLVYN